MSPAPTLAHIAAPASRPMNESMAGATGSDVHRRHPRSSSVIAGLSLLLSTGCASLDDGTKPLLSASHQECIECAIRRSKEGQAAEELARGRTASEAASFFQGLCSAGDARSCSVLGVMLQEGHGVAANPARAAQLFQKACRAGNAGACVNFGRMLTERQPSARFDGSGPDAQFDRSGPKGPDLDAAAILFEMACHQNAAEGCYQLGLLRYSAGDPDAATAPLERACSAGHADACEGLGAMYLHGHGVTADPDKAAALMRRACGLGSEAACQRHDGELANAAPASIDLKARRTEQ